MDYQGGKVIPYVFLAVAVVYLGRFIVLGLRNPLNAVPGPLLAKWTNIPLKLATITGRRMYHVHDLHEKYGPFVRVAPSEIAVADPEAFVQIHKIGGPFVKSEWYQSLTGLQRRGVFTMTDTKMHGARRKLLARAFSKTYLRENWETVVAARIDLAVSRIKDEIEQQGTADLLKWWTFMATDVSVNLMFGDSFHMLEKGEKDHYIHVLETALQGGGIGSELPLVRFLGNRLLSRSVNKSFQANEYLLEHAEVAVTNAKAGGEKNCFAHIIREANKSEQLDELDMKTEAVSFIIAGSDTTAVSTTYLVWAVLSRPKLAELLKDEVSKVSDGYTDRDLEELPILNAVIDETLRLYGAAPGMTPRMVPPNGVQLGGHFLPSGTTVTTQGYSMHRDSYHFPQPMEFDHTRWLPSNTSQDSSSRKSPNPELAKAIYTPFGAGARTCIGIHLAKMELRHAATEFFRQCGNAKLSPRSTPESMEMENYFLIAPKSHRLEVQF